MNRLILNTANSDLTILLETNGKLFSYVLNSKSHHNETMLPAIDELLKKHKLEINKINEFGVVIGPGSFTGIRVGVATIKAFRDALNVKAKGINNLDLLFNLATSQNEKIDTVAIKGSEDSYFVAKKINDIVYKFERNLTKQELVNLTTNPIGMFENGGIENAYIVKFDEKILFETFLKSEDYSLIPVYYQLSQAEREKLKRGKIQIKKSVKADIDKIIEIEKQSIKVNTLSESEIKEISKNKNYQIFVCKFNDEVVGFVIAQITDEVNIVSIAVLKDFRNLGLGGGLIKKVEKFAKHSGIKTISLEVSKNNITAYLLYQKCGFTLRRVRKNYYADKSDCFEMIKTL